MIADDSSFQGSMHGIFAFEWSVHSVGYEWDADLRPHPDMPLPPVEPLLDDHLSPDWERAGPWLVPRWQSEPPRRYRPLEVPGLHRKFATLTTQDTIQRFASKYGQLGRQVTLCSSAQGGDEDICRGESLAYWRHHISWMDSLIHIWDLIQREKAGELAEYIRWDPPTFRYPTVRVCFDLPTRVTEERWIVWPFTHFIGWAGPWASHDLVPPELASVRGDRLEPARYAVCQLINARMANHVQPRLVPWAKGEIALYPDSLLSAMYALFALEVSGKERPPRLCVGCGKYYSPVHGRQQYCDERCRKRAFRQRQKA